MEREAPGLTYREVRSARARGLLRHSRPPEWLRLNPTKLCLMHHAQRLGELADRKTTRLARKSQEDGVGRTTVGTPPKITAPPTGDQGNASGSPQG